MSSLPRFSALGNISAWLRAIPESAESKINASIFTNYPEFTKLVDHLNNEAIWNWMIQTDHLVTRYLSWPLLNCWPLPCWVFHGLRLPVGLCHVGSFIASGYLLASATLYLSWAPISCWPLPRCNFPGLWLPVGLVTLYLSWAPVTCWPLLRCVSVISWSPWRLLVGWSWPGSRRPPPPPAWRQVFVVGFEPDTVAFWRSVLGKRQTFCFATSNNKTPFRSWNLRHLLSDIATTTTPTTLRQRDAKNATFVTEVLS